jgi:hypothetical protein
MAFCAARVIATFRSLSKPKMFQCVGVSAMGYAKSSSSGMLGIAGAINFPSLNSRPPLRGPAPVDKWSD